MATVDQIDRNYQYAPDIDDFQLHAIRDFFYFCIEQLVYIVSQDLEYEGDNVIIVKEPIRVLDVSDHQHTQKPENLGLHLLRTDFQLLQVLLLEHSKEFIKQSLSIV